MVVMRSWHEYMTAYRGEQIGISCGHQDALNRVKRARNREEGELAFDTALTRKHEKEIRISRLRLEVTVMAKDSRVSPA